MDKVIIAGVDTILGGNLAAWLSDRFEVLGLSLGDAVQVAGCETALCPETEEHTIQAWIAAERPQWLIYCGPAAESAWSAGSASERLQSAATLVRPWVVAAAACECALTVISSDAVFTGPWMFHDEESTDFCTSAPARALRQMEQLVTELYPEAQLIRTNTFGWSPVNGTCGFAEQTLADLFAGQPMNLDYQRHATPILATDLAEILEKAYLAGLQGLYHVGGAERLNPYRLGIMLAQRFGCAYTPPSASQQTGSDQKAGDGETSLQSLKIRKALGISLPLVGEGLERLHEQSVNGYRDQFGTGVSLLQEATA